jgi:hypothetical protein
MHNQSNECMCTCSGVRRRALRLLVEYKLPFPLIRELPLRPDRTGRARSWALGAAQILRSSTGWRWGELLASWVLRERRKVKTKTVYTSDKLMQRTRLCSILVHFVIISHVVMV